MLTPNTKVSIKDSDGSTYKEYRLDLKPNSYSSRQENDTWSENNCKKIWSIQKFYLPLYSK